MGFHVVPIPDPGKSLRFGVKKIYDLGLLWGGQYHAVELKEVAGSGWSWSIKDLKPHQEANLLDAEERGGIGLVVLNFAIRLSKARIAKLGFETIKRAFAVRIHTIVAERDTNCRTSLDFDWWNVNGCEMMPIHGLTNNEGNPVKAWDPSNILADDSINPNRVFRHKFKPVGP